MRVDSFLFGKLFIISVFIFTLNFDIAHSLGPLNISSNDSFKNLRNIFEMRSQCATNDYDYECKHDPRSVSPYDEAIKTELQVSHDILSFFEVKKLFSKDLAFVEIFDKCIGRFCTAYTYLGNKKELCEISFVKSGQASMTCLDETYNITQMRYSIFSKIKYGSMFDLINDDSDISALEYTNIFAINMFFGPLYTDLAEEYFPNGQKFKKIYKQINFIKSNPGKYKINFYTIGSDMYPG